MPKKLSKSEQESRIAEIEKVRAKLARKKQVSKIAIQVFAVILVIGMILTSLSVLMY
ncbi:MAG: hypothetical protein AAGF07_02225 [Patescibacteria group bacterium]